MRNVPIDNWRPASHFAYYAHVASAPNGTAVGLVLARSGSGRQPCRGSHTDRPPGNASEPGALLVNPRDDTPMAGVVVQYFDTGGQLIQETTTDGAGQHLLWLEPGDYEYRYLIDGVSSAPQQVSVSKGFVIEWQDAATDPVDADAGAPTLSREVGMVFEDLICDWNTEDNLPFSWPDVEQVIVDVAQAVDAAGGDMRQVSFAGFERPDMISSLQNRGVNAVDVKWRDQQLANAYHNLRGLAGAGLVLPLSEDAPGVSPALRYCITRADFQMIRAIEFSTERKVTASEGMHKYLADCRAAAYYFAAQNAAFDAPGASHIMFLGEAMESIDGMRLPRDATQVMGSMRKMFGLGEVPPVIPTMADFRKYGGLG